MMCVSSKYKLQDTVCDFPHLLFLASENESREMETLEQTMIDVGFEQ